MKIPEGTPAGRFSAHHPVYLWSDVQEIIEEAIKQERERVRDEQHAPSPFHRWLCTGDGCEECARVEALLAPLRARSSAPADTLEK